MGGETEGRRRKGNSCWNVIYKRRIKTQTVSRKVEGSQGRKGTKRPARGEQRAGRDKAAKNRARMGRRVGRGNRKGIGKVHKGKQGGGGSPVKERYKKGSRVEEGSTVSEVAETGIGRQKERSKDLKWNREGGGEHKKMGIGRGRREVLKCKCSGGEGQGKVRR